MIRPVLELARIVIYLFLGLYLLYELEVFLITELKGSLPANSPLYLFAANLMWLFVIYRNRLQFTGWYKKGSQRLSTPIARVLTVAPLFIIGVVCLL
jgi:hypothetical protein